MFEKIVVAVDGSEHSAKAVPVAAEVASKFGSEVVVVHVFERAVGRGGIYELETPAEASEVVDEAVRLLKDAGVSAGGEIRRSIQGHAAREILDVAEREGAGLVVLGSRGLGELSGMLLGSVTNKLLHLAHLPVLVAR